MKNFIKASLIICSAILLYGCQSSQVEYGYTALEDMDRVDQAVQIPSGTEFLEMNEDSKTIIYESLDAIGTDSQGTARPTDYSNIEGIDSEQEYVDFLQKNKDEAKIVYIGFDECPWCKAFSPKINQLASEFDVPVYYYNTRTRSEDVTYSQTMENFGVETVPYAFVMVEGEPTDRISHLSSMQQIEDFFRKFSEEYMTN